MATDSFREFAPPRGLAELVWSFWVHRADDDRDSPVESRFVPDGSVRLVHRVGDVVRIVGPHDAPVVRRMAAGTTVIGARLRPGGRWLLGGAPVSELRGQTIRADDLPGRWARQFTNRLNEVETPRQALGVLAGLLATRAATSASPDPVVAETVNRFLAGPEVRVDRAAAATGISSRQLRRRCVPEIGLEPKTLQRLLRFQRVLAHLHTGDPGSGTDGPTLATLASHAGFCDQSHLSHECRTLTGASLQRFVVETRQRCRHDHDHAAAFAPLRAVPR